MIKFDIFDENNNELLCPDWHETVWDLISFVKDKYPKIEKKEVKRLVLGILKQLLDKKIIYLVDDDNNSKIQKDVYEIINYLNEKWKDHFDFPEYYSLNFYKFENWYINALRNLGYSFNIIDWDVFVKKNIIDFEKWLEENRDKCL